MTKNQECVLHLHHTISGVLNILLVDIRFYSGLKMIDQLPNSLSNKRIQPNIYQMMKNQERILPLYHAICTTLNEEEPRVDPTPAPCHIYDFQWHFMFQYIHEAKGTVTLHISIMV